MVQELKETLSCNGSKQEEKRKSCSKCITSGTTFIPDSIEIIPRENGIMQMIELAKASPSEQFECGRECPHHYHYHHHS